MLQEILHNTIKHAGAKQFSVDARMEGPELIIDTRDDGRGFDLAAAQEKGGFLAREPDLEEDVEGDGDDGEPQRDKPR